MGPVLLALAVVIFAARVGGWAAVRIGQPRVVGEILAGVVIGPSALGLLGGVVTTDRLFPAEVRSALGVIGQLGLLMFMLLVGVVFEPADVGRRWPAVGVVAVTVVAVPVGLGFALSPVLDSDRFSTGASATAFALFLGAMLSVSAFPVTVRILEELRLERSTLGVVAIAAAAVVTVLMFIVSATARAVADGADAGGLVAVPVRAVAYLGIMLLVVRPALRVVGDRIAGLPTGGGLAVVAVVTLVSGRLAVEADLGVIVGGFIAGVVLPRRDVLAPVVIARTSDLVATILLPVFLATSGLITDLTSVGVGSLPGIAVFLVAAVVAKLAVGWAVARAVGLADHEARILGALMNCRGLLVLVIGMTAVEAGVITAQMQVGSVLVALVTTAMTGPIVNRSLAASTPVSVR
ncbi:MAG: cation:proton antiporter [Ilumatobacteraceae bacterium]